MPLLVLVLIGFRLLSGHSSQTSINHQHSYQRTNSTNTYTQQWLSFVDQHPIDAEDRLELPHWKLHVRSGGHGTRSPGQNRGVDGWLPHGRLDHARLGRHRHQLWRGRRQPSTRRAFQKGPRTDAVPRSRKPRQTREGTESSVGETWSSPWSSSSKLHFNRITCIPWPRHQRSQGHLRSHKYHLISPPP